MSTPVPVPMATEASGKGGPRKGAVLGGQPSEPAPASQVRVGVGSFLGGRGF